MKKESKELLAKLLKGEIRALSKAITLIESSRAEDRNEANYLLEKIQNDKSLIEKNSSMRIGITGTPGVGKSTFIEIFGLYIIGQGKKVAVLTIDPSSPISGGSILGDKTRMEKLSQNKNAYIRPSAAGNTLGGVAGKTREAMYLLEAAGFDYILVETVGVGQSEHEAASMVDFFAVLTLPNAGDELQGIKKGILELADAIIINKADGESESLATRSLAHYEGALGLISSHSFWQPKAMTCSALFNHNIDKVFEMIEEYSSCSKSKGEFLKKRNLQNKQWVKRLILDLIEQKLNSNPKTKKTWEQEENKVQNGQTTAYLAAKNILSTLKL